MLEGRRTSARASSSATSRRRFPTTARTSSCAAGVAFARPWRPMRSSRWGTGTCARWTAGGVAGPSSDTPSSATDGSRPPPGRELDDAGHPARERARQHLALPDQRRKGRLLRGVLLQPAEELSTRGLDPRGALDRLPAHVTPLELDE